MIYLLLSSVLVLTTAQWIQETETLSWSDYGQAIGYYNGKITLLGGNSNKYKRAMVQFDTVTKTITSNTTNSSSITADINCYGQTWTQNGKILYMTANGDQFAIYNLETNIMNMEGSFPINMAAGGACLVMTDNKYLWVMGGHCLNCAYFVDVQIYDIVTKQWIAQTPSLNEGRIRAACVYLHNRVYVIGGYDGGVLSSIEAIEANDMENIGTLSWTLRSNMLSPARSGSRAVPYGTDIVIVGGCGDSSFFCETFIAQNLIYHTTTDTIENTDIMTVGFFCAGAIMDNTYTMYTFGGQNWDFPLGRMNVIQSIQLEPPMTNAPTPQTFDPTKGPTNNPSTSTAPSNAPSKAPSNAPTAAPSTAPSNAPSKAPSDAPSNPSTNAPSNPTSTAPSTAPSKAPSNAPTAAPTRVPTSVDAYDSQIDILYELNTISANDMLNTISANAIDVMNDIERKIEMGYVNDKELIISYRDFWVQILKLNDYSIADINPSVFDNSENPLFMSLKLTSTIKCNEIVCRHLITKLDNYEETFESFVTQELINYFYTETTNRVLLQQPLEFFIISMEYKPNPPSTNDVYDSASNYIFYGLLCVTFIIIIIGFIGCCYNDGICCKCPRVKGCATVDDGKYTAVIAYALHFYDVISDINLCTEIWIANGNIFNDILLLICGIGSIVFIVIPYVANLYIATNIKNMISNNVFAKTWFQYYAYTFTFLVVLTGGAYPTLKLISSNIFGLSITSSGLTQYELAKMSKIRVYCNVILENIPQLIFQIIYALSINKMSQAVIFAFIASLLSVITTIISYFIERNDGNLRVIEYYLITERLNDDCVSPSGDDVQEVITTPGSIYRVQSKSIQSIHNRAITKKERLNININKGRRKSLAISMAELFGIPRKNIQIGTTMLTKYGMITHIIHFVTAGNEERKDLTHFIDQLYSALKLEVNDLICTHFRLSYEFKVSVTYNASSYIDTVFYDSQQTDDKRNNDKNTSIHDQMALTLEMTDNNNNVQ